MSVDWKGPYPIMGQNEQPTSKITSRKRSRMKRKVKKNLKKSSCDLVTARSEQMLLFTKCIQAEAFLVSTDLQVLAPIKKAKKVSKKETNIF